MTDYEMIHDKNFNQEKLHEEMDAAGLAGGSLYWAGFDPISRRVYGPSTIHGHPAGKLRFSYDPALTPQREQALNDILVAHDGTQLSKFQQHKDTDELHRLQFVQTAIEWNTLNNNVKLDRVEYLFRAVARLIDSTTDL